MHRRGTGGELDLQLHRPARKARQAGPAPVAAIDDQGAIRDGFARLYAAATNARLADAAVCARVRLAGGINGTRAMTAFNSKTGGFHLHRRPGADPDPRHRRRAGEENP